MMSVGRMLGSVKQTPVLLNRMAGHVQQRMAKSTHHVEVGENRSVAYKQMPGTKQPTIVHVPGLHSYAHMNGMTAKSILRYRLTKDSVSRPPLRLASDSKLVCS